MLRIAIPISQSDIHLLDGFVKNFIHVGGAPSSVVTLFPTASMESPARDAARKLEGFAREVSVERLERDYGGGWPAACNQHFMWTVEALHAIGNTFPWIWMELDTTIMTPGWDTALDTKYVMECGSHGWFGAILPTRKKYGKRNNLGLFEGPVTMVIDDADKHMAGVCIHPANTIQAIDKQHRYPSADEPFDTALRYYMKRDWHNTELIQHLCGTANATRLEDGRIFLSKCDDERFKDDDRSGFVSPRAVLVHGCKDGSLARLIMGSVESTPSQVEIAPQSTEISSPSPTPSKSSVPVTPPRFTREGLIPNPPSADSDTVMAARLAARKAQSSEELEAAQPALERIRPLLSDKPKRIGDLAKVSGLSVQELTLLSRNPLNKLRVKGPARWVELVK